MTMRAIFRVLAGGGAAVILAALFAATLEAHPTATSFVDIRLAENGRVGVTLTTDAKALVLKLRALSTVFSSDPIVPEESYITESSARLVERLVLSVDGTPIPLALESVSRLKDRSQLIQVHLRATLPANARTLVWKTDLFLGSYPLSIRSGQKANVAAEDADYEWLSGATPSPTFDLRSATPGDNRWTRVGRLVATGFTHIVPAGLDHMLFVLGLFLLANGARTLLLQITAFTLAHSVSLALAVTGFVSIPSVIVEPLIAASIVYVAVENVMTSRLSRWRLAVVFAFGLLHGLGFAGALADLGIDRAHVAETLVGFNIGVECGQLAVVAAAAILLSMLPIPAERRRGFITVPVSLAIAAIGAFWAVERLS
jgi:hydrogenase/urease accessory protein HupE